MNNAKRWELEGIVFGHLASLAIEDPSSQSYAEHWHGIIAIGEAAGSPLRYALKSDCVRLRCIGAALLAEMKDESALEALAVMLYDADAGIRSGAHGALVKYGGNAVPHLIGNFLRLETRDRNQELTISALVEIGVPAVPALVRQLYGAGAGRSEAHETLVRIGEPAVPGIIAQLGRMGYGYAGTAPYIEVLRDIGSITAVPALIATLKNGASDSAEALAKIRHPDGVKALVEVASDARRGFGIRNAAMQRLVEIDKELAIPILIRALHDDEFFVRVNAAELLVKLGLADRAEEEIFAVMEGDSARREHCIYLIGFIDRKRREAGGGAEDRVRAQPVDITRLDFRSAMRQMKRREAMPAKTVGQPLPKQMFAGAVI